MTENKRFKVKDGFDHENKPCKLIEDTLTTEQYDTSNELEANSLCKLLNKIDGQLGSMASGQDSLIKRIRTLEKENKELKKEIEDTWRKYEDAHGISIRNTDWY